MIKNDTDIDIDTRMDPTITLKNMGGTYTVKVDDLHLAMIQIRNRGLSLETIQSLAADACGYPDTVEPFRAWQEIEVIVAWVESGNFIL